MGLSKRTDFDHSKASAYEAAGYSFETVGRELEPRAALLANQIVDEAGMCPTMTVELLMDSALLKDNVLDDRDRAMIVLMTGPVIASAFMQQLMKEPPGLSRGTCISKYGFDHNSGKEQHEILKMSQPEWERLTQYVRNQVLGEAPGQSVSRLIENMERVLGDHALNGLEKAIVESLVARQSAIETARQIVPTSAVIGALATIGRGASPAGDQSYVG
jgi:hypothetical protein